MANEQRSRSAEIIAFVRPESASKFTVADRIELLRFEAREKNVRLAIHTRCDLDPPEIGEFASIYPAGHKWAAWGAVRQGRKIAVWRAKDGRDLGPFETMGEALAALSVPGARQPRR